MSQSTGATFSRQIERYQSVENSKNIKLASLGIEGPWCSRWIFPLGKDEGINVKIDII